MKSGGEMNLFYCHEVIENTDITVIFYNTLPHFFLIWGENVWEEFLHDLLLWDLTESWETRESEEAGSISQP